MGKDYEFGFVNLKSEVPVSRSNIEVNIYAKLELSREIRMEIHI